MPPKGRASGSSSRGAHGMGKSSNRQRQEEEVEVEDLGGRFPSMEVKELYLKYYAKVTIVHEKELLRETVHSEEFWEKIQDLGLDKLTSLSTGKVNETWVREFFANLNAVDLAKGIVRVRDTEVNFSSEVINNYYDLPPSIDKDYDEVIKALDEAMVDWREECRLVLCSGIDWIKGANHCLPFKLMPIESKVWFRFINNRIRPLDGSSRFNTDDFGVFYALWHGHPINVGKMQYNMIVRRAT